MSQLRDNPHLPQSSRKAIEKELRGVQRPRKPNEGTPQNPAPKKEK